MMMEANGGGEMKFCAECLDYTNHSSFVEKDVFTVRGDDIEVKVKKHKCSDCGFVNTDQAKINDYYQEAYDRYRKNNNIVFPQDIKEIIDAYGMSQRLLAKILGWSHVTITRYLQGAIPSKSHNNELHLIRDPYNMLRLLELNQVDLSDKEVERAKKKIVTLFNNKNFFAEDRKARLEYNIESMDKEENIYIAE